MGRRNDRKSGFTLIELLVVIAIIALLISLLVPSLARAKDLARKVACAANVRSIGLALTQYTHDYHDWMPKMVSEDRSTNYCLEMSLYLGCREHQWFPWVNPTSRPTAFEPSPGAPGVFVCPSERTDWGEHILAYGWNYTCFGAWYDHGWSPRRKTTEVARPGETSPLGESRPMPGGWWHPIETAPYWGNFESGFDDGHSEFWAGKRHDEGANYLCVDGHGEYARFDDLVDDWVSGSFRIFGRGE